MVSRAVQSNLIQFSWHNFQTLQIVVCKSGYSLDVGSTIGIILMS